MADERTRLNISAVWYMKCLAIWTAINIDISHLSLTGTVCLGVANELFLQISVLMPTDGKNRCIYICTEILI